jgi:L-asparaginase
VAGPLGHVIDGAPRLLWRPPRRFTVPGPYAGRPLRVGLHTVTLGDDGELLRAVAALCDGLVVAAPSAVVVPAAVAVPGTLMPILTEAAARVPVVVAGGRGEGLPATGLAPAKARVLMHLLLDAGRDRDGVLAAFADLDRDEAGRT